MAETKNAADTKKQLTELLSCLRDGVDRQIIQSEKDLEGFVRVMPQMQRALLVLQGVEANATLLEILGYEYGDVEDHPVKKVVIGQISYSPDYILKGEQKHLAILDLKEPDVDLDHSKWLGQIRSYCVHLGAPIGILFNGHSIRIYINTSLKSLAKYGDLFADQPVAEVSNRKLDDLVDVLLKLTNTSLKKDPLAIARKLASKKKGEIDSEKRRKQIRERIKHLLMNPPDDLLTSMSGIEGIWDDISPKPSQQEVIAAWSLKSEPLTVNVVEMTAKLSINGIVRQKVAEVCAAKGWDCLEEAKLKKKVKGLCHRLQGGNGYHPVPQTEGVPANLHVGGLATEDAKKLIQRLEDLL